MISNFKRLKLYMGFSFCRFGRIIYKVNSERKETNNEEFC